MLGLFVVFCCALVAGFIYSVDLVQDQALSETEQVMHKGYQRGLQFAIETLASNLGKVVADAKAGGGDAVEALRGAIKPVRYGKKGYYFIYDTKGYNIAHPLREDFQGKLRIDTKDTKGNPYISQLIDKAKAGGGFVTYWFNKPNEKNPSPKLAYAEMIPGTDWLLATGLYIDDIQTERTRITGVIAEHLAAHFKNLTFLYGGITLFVILPICFVIMRSILLPLRDATKAAKQIATGDLSSSVDIVGDDEVSQLQQALIALIERMSENMRQIEEKSRESEEQARAAATACKDAESAREMAESARSEGLLAAASRLDDSVDALSHAAQEINSQVQVISSGAEHQQEGVTEVVVAMEQMNEAAVDVAHNTAEVAGESEKTMMRVHEGAEIVKESIAAMQTVELLTKELTEDMNKLGDRTNAIGQVMSMINDIADQTNLLALNAAIEAARAGDAGRGFAVVADEVRKLAEKTMAATSDVDKLINAIQQAAQENLNGMNKAVQAINKASELTNNSGGLLEDILDYAGKSSMRIQEIAAAMEQQSASFEQINRTIENIQAIARETTRNVRQTSDASGGVMGQASQLQRLIQDLKKDGRAN